MAQHGRQSWTEAARQAFPGRTGKRLRERYLHQLDPTINHGRATPEEEALLMRLVGSMGPQWVAIAQKLPGRTDNWCKNRYATLSGKRRQRGAPRSEPAPAVTPSVSVPCSQPAPIPDSVFALERIPELLCWHDDRWSEPDDFMLNF